MDQELICEARLAEARFVAETLAERSRHRRRFAPPVANAGAAPATVEPTRAASTGVAWPLWWSRTTRFLSRAR